MRYTLRSNSPTKLPRPSRSSSNPCRFIIDFPNVSFKEQPRTLPVNKNGVNEVRVSVNNGNPPGTRLVVGIDSVRPFGIETSGNKFVLSILPPSNAQPGATGAEAIHWSGRRKRCPELEPAAGVIAAYSRSSPPEVEHLPLESVIDEPRDRTRGHVSAKVQSQVHCGKNGVYRRRLQFGTSR